MGRGYRSYEDVLEKLQELLKLREELCDLVGSDDNNVLLKWIEDAKSFSHPCPGKFLLGLTKPKQEVVKRTWDDFLNILKRKGISQKNIDFIMEKLSKSETIEEAAAVFKSLQGEIKNDFTGLKEKNSKRTFQ
jgi:hypothetical protein